MIKPRRASCGQVWPQAAGTADPQDDLEVAQSAGRLLEIGLEAVGAVLELGVALLLLEALRLEENLRVDALAAGAVEAREKLAAAGEQSRLEAGSSSR